MSARAAIGVGISAAGVAAVYMQFFNNPEAPPVKEGESRIKRTLTNGGLMPEPNKKGIQRRPSGSMAVFTEGGPALGGAEGGAAH